MQSAEPADHVVSGPEVEVVRVAEKNLNLQVSQLLRRHRLHCCLGTDWHEDRCLDDSMRQVQPPSTRARPLISIDQFKFHYSTRWQAARRLSASRRSGGSSTLQRSTAIGQRV